MSFASKEGILKTQVYVLVIVFESMYAAKYVHN